MTQSYCLRLCTLFLCSVPAGVAAAQLTPGQLTCEYLPDPGVVDVARPRLSWINTAQAGARGQRQTAWQVRVASSTALLDSPDLWDSQKVASAQSTRIVYGGQSLTSRQECWWQVRVWDRDDRVSGWSQPAWWRMGLLKPSDWRASWIGAPWQGEEALPKPPGGPDARPQVLPPPAPLLRKSFELGDQPIARAVAFVTGLGYFQLYLNGQRVGDDELVPNQTNYGKRPSLVDGNIPLPDNFRDYTVMYLAYDVKDLLQAGKNVVGGLLGNGFYNAPKFWTASYGSPRFLLQLHVTYADGTEQVVVSDTSWKAAKSAILMDLVYHGEHYDARREIPGWCTPEVDDAAWQHVAAREPPSGRLVAHTADPDKVTARLAPVSIEHLGDGKYRVDFGVEISGRLRINRISGPAGHKVEFKYLSNLYSGDNTYTLRGGDEQSYASRFNWFVFSAVEITNWPGELEQDQLTAEAVNTWIEETAAFETSNALFNDIHRIWKRSQLDNMHGGVASDCPHRERSAYTGDGQVACVTVMHNYDARAFYKKWIRDIRDAQIVDSGYVPNGAPWQPGCGGGVAWGAAIAIMPWEFYVHYGDVDILEENYDAMQGYVRYMQRWVDDKGIMFSQAVGKNGQPLKWLNLGDWSEPGEPLPLPLVHTFYFWRCAQITSQTAAVLGQRDEAERYAALAQRTRRAFQEQFFDDVQGTYGAGGGNIYALQMGLPPEQRDRVLRAVRRDIQAADGHLDTGIFGTQFFFEVLAENGLQDLALAAMNKRTEPSFGYWLEQGATTFREDWDSSGSHNHPMFGGGIAWFYRKLAGMQADPEQPGYRHIIFRPQPAGDLSYVSYSNLTPLGRAGIAWRGEDGTFTMKVTVPVGSRATVHVPAPSAEAVTEGATAAAQAPDVAYRAYVDGYAIYEVGSGEYSFAAN